MLIRRKRGGDGEDDAEVTRRLEVHTETGPQDAGVRPAHRRLLYAVLAAVLVTVGALAVATRLKSPAQVAAETAPPPPSTLTEPVERRVLNASVVLRGKVGAEQSVEVRARGGTEGTPVVTALKVGYGAEVTSAQVLMEISGRPVFALPGATPAYRDLRPGATGKDVAQLQKALTRLGFGRGGDAWGTYGPGTKNAVREFYESKGYEPMPAGPDDETLLLQAETALTAAERALRDAELALEAAPAAGKATARIAVGDRREDLAQARRERGRVTRRTGPMMPAGEIVYLRGFPGRVDKVSASVGALAEDALLTVSAGRLVVKGRLTAYQKDLIRPGMPVEILSEISGTTAKASVRSVADTPAQPEQASGDAATTDPTLTGYEMVAVPGGALDANLAGEDVRLTVTAASSEGEVLVVPLAAVSAGADGKTSVTVVDGAARQRIEVVPGLVGDGFVQVTPVGGAALEPGAQVLVGT
ncbi:peptidoglycan-binding domain-containing protein [Actinoplanes sp. NPDC049802]|uniref:peptidoglycan-binding domain-containing protein n=1 Tax=Actinoplanes sp. NPDC049802 TaxID=3154742 RepID=UPI0033C6683A